MLIDGLVALIKADSPVTALVAARVYIAVAPRDYILPALIVHRYGGSQDYDYAGPVSVREDLIQVDAYAKTADDCQKLAELVRSLLASYTGTLADADSTVVQACYLERDMDMPYLPNANSVGVANRRSLSFKVVSVRS